MCKPGRATATIAQLQRFGMTAARAERLMRDMVSKALTELTDLYIVRYAALQRQQQGLRMPGGGRDCCLYRRHHRTADTPPATETNTASAADYAVARPTVADDVCRRIGGGVAQVLVPNRRRRHHVGAAYDVGDDFGA
jgi:hypothetical protein